jgi:hypothetical protein
MPETRLVPFGLAGLILDLLGRTSLISYRLDTVIQAFEWALVRTAYAHNHGEKPFTPQRFQQSGIDKTGFAKPRTPEQQHQAFDKH